MQTLDTHLADEQYGSALDVMDEIRALGGELPASLLYFEAKAALATGDHERSLQAIEAFLNTPDVQKGPHYKSALTLFTEVDLARMTTKAVTAAFRPGDTFKECGACPEIVVIPPGQFEMGTASRERIGDWEGPQHRVTIRTPFAVGKYEVTFREWDYCVGNVSWADAKQYLRWLSRKTGAEYRFLSEAEWEYAARAGTTTPFHFGSTISTDQANYNGNGTYGNGHRGVNRDKTVSVGSFPSNAFGLHDMHGNVEEWVEDCVHDSYSGAPNDGSAWTTENCVVRIFRGGAYYQSPGAVCSATRGRQMIYVMFDHLGFRVARTLP